MPIQAFIRRVQDLYRTGQATEHSYRSALEQLFHALDDHVTALNEPKRVACGAPDFIISRGAIVIGHLEAKDLGVALRGMKDANKAQQERYRQALPNLIYTNCLDWDFYRDGERIATVTIGELIPELQPHTAHFATLEHLLRDFIAQRPQTITSPRDLAERMAGKARLIKDILYNTLSTDLACEHELSGQYRAFREYLIEDIQPADFADLYAETIAYGLFAARLHDTDLVSFSRQQALTLLPKSNPFLRSLFGYVAGIDLDDRIAWIIDDLADVFQAADVKAIMANFGQLTGQQDPFLHFYETFLAAYNPAKRKARGVWYTPEPVVQFIVRAVDEVLQGEFGLADGLADTSKISIDWDTGQSDKKGRRQTIKKAVHRVQILDPATGTGTFLAEVIKQIAPKVKDIAPGMWSGYIEEDLIPRLHGLEILMASYAMCHLKLDMMLTELGYQPSMSPPRLSVYLTNSLEEGSPANQTLLFSQWLTREAKGANAIKRDLPIMCVIGNPPYLGEGGISTGWMGQLMEDYKKEPGGKEKLKERNPKWLNDLYVKFIRLSSHLIDKNGEGVLGFITNHGYLDNPTFRGMRWHLLKSFDKLWVLDLHGNTKKKEVTPEGKPDKNVFDIQQGVAILIGVKKKGKRTGLAEVMHGDLWGERALKYRTLEKMTLTAPIFSKLQPPAPQYPLVKRDFSKWKLYEQGFSINQFMPINSVGIVTARDALTIDENKETLWARVNDFAKLDTEEARKKYHLGNDVRDWKVEWAQKDVKANLDQSKLVLLAYRPFDHYWTFYTGKSRGFLCYPRYDVMRHMIVGNNFSLIYSRQAISGKTSSFNIFLTDKIFDNRGIFSNKGISQVAPLYLYPSDQDLDQTRRINFDPKLYAKLQQLTEHPEHGKPDEVAVFDYLYGVLHCPAYRDTYAEFLKIDFPRIPWPDSSEEFWDVSAKGTQLRQLHLMDPAAIGATPYPFTGDGDNCVDKPRFDDGKIWINPSQYFAAASVVSWNFYIGGYQPAQKWLKDRKGRALNFADIKHYQRILKILAETDRIMGTISLSTLPTTAQPLETTAKVDL
jgi:hypothetical protein